MSLRYFIACFSRSSLFARLLRKMLSRLLFRRSLLYLRRSTTSIDMFDGNLIVFKQMPSEFFTLKEIIQKITFTHHAENNYNGNQILLRFIGLLEEQLEYNTVIPMR